MHYLKNAKQVLAREDVKLVAAPKKGAQKKKGENYIISSVIPILSLILLLK
jgi:hypothetical protein